MSKKIVIFGASGWLGRMTLNYLNKVDKSLDLILVSSKNRKIKRGENKFNFISPYEFLNLKNYEIDYYFNFAFLTQDKLDHLMKSEYINKTDEIIDLNTNFLRKNEVKNSLLISSGAVYWKSTEKENLYATQKLKQEEEFLKFNSNPYIARIFAVIGSQFKTNNNYAFTNFVSQGLDKKDLKIKSKIRVMRSYLYFENLLDNFINQKINSNLFDAWDENLDIYDLAQNIGEILNVNVQVDGEYVDSIEVDDYTSNDLSYNKHHGMKISKDDLKKAIFEDYIL